MLMFRPPIFLALCLLALAPAAQSAPCHAARLAQLLTGDRQQHRTSMTPDPILTGVAMERARDMASKGYFSHVNREGEGVNYLVEKAGYPLAPWLLTSRKLNTLESICAGYASPDAAWQSWMKSRPHRTHLLGLRGFYAQQTRYGVGVAYNPASPLKYYYVVITAPPREAAAAGAAMMRRENGMQPWFGAMR